MAADGVGWLLLRNEVAGSDGAERVEAIAGGLAVHGPAEVVATAGPDDVDAALEAAAGRTVVVCGGDGSIQLAVQRAHALGLLGDLTFGIVPLGTGNDLAGHLGLEQAATQPTVERLASSRPVPLDLVVTDDDRVVVNAVHIGIGVEAAARATDLKEAFGALAYPMGALTAGVAAEGLEVEVRLDGERLDLDRPALMVIVANGSTIGGGTPVAPAARTDDGLLDVVVVHAVDPAARMAFAAALVRGTHPARDDVVAGRGREVTIDGSSLAHNRDGELEPVGDGPRTYRVEPGAWQLLLPRDAD